MSLAPGTRLGPYEIVAPAGAGGMGEVYRARDTRLGRTVALKILPGEIIPAAKALHSNEALLIFLINALWHIINAVFSPEVFPLDSSIFTGYISRERMAREHPLELARLEEGTSE